MTFKTLSVIYKLNQNSIQVIIMKQEFPKKIILKDNSECEFRLNHSGTVDELLDFFNRVPTDDIWAMKRDYTKKENVEFLLYLYEHKEMLKVFAYQGNKLVGLGVINYYKFGAKKDIGEIEIMLDSSFKQKRLGTWMMMELSSLAAEIDLKLLRIDLMAGKDDPAIIALKRSNFIPHAILKNYLQNKDGSFSDQVILIKEIKEEWSDY